MKKKLKRGKKKERERMLKEVEILPPHLILFF